MSDQHIIFSPEHNQWTLTDGRHHMEVPEWAREIMRDEFDRETRPLQAEADMLREENERFIIKLNAEHIVRQNVEAENVKLRRLVHRLISHVEHPPCEGCLAEMSCDGEHVTQCDEWLFMVADARELGIEVD